MVILLFKFRGGRTGGRAREREGKELSESGRRERGKSKTITRTSLIWRNKQWFLFNHLCKSIKSQQSFSPQQQTKETVEEALVIMMMMIVEWGSASGEWEGRRKKRPFVKEQFERYNTNEGLTPPSTTPTLYLLPKTVTLSSSTKDEVGVRGEGCGGKERREGNVKKKKSQISKIEFESIGKKFQPLIT